MLFILQQDIQVPGLNGLDFYWTGAIDAYFGSWVISPSTGFLRVIVDNLYVCQSAFSSPLVNVAHFRHSRNSKLNQDYGIVYRQALTVIEYNPETVHLMTRHHRRISSGGYSYPLTDSAWLAFLVSTLILMTIVHFGNKIVRRKYDLFNVLPLICMFHYDSDNSYMMKNLKAGNVHVHVQYRINNYCIYAIQGKIIIMLCLLIYFSFINTYNQNIRASTIEPFFETLPDHLNQVNPHKSIVVMYGPYQFASGFW